MQCFDNDRPKRAVVAVIRDGDNFLAIKRAENIRAPGKICFPGGGIESNESEEIALVREIKEELGDVLLQVLMHAQIASDENNFNISDVVQELNKKIIRRHGHVFGENKTKDEDKIKEMWEETKRAEKIKYKRMHNSY